jgi:hypothetical protein
MTPVQPLSCQSCASLSSHLGSSVTTDVTTSFWTGIMPASSKTASHPSSVSGTPPLGYGSWTWHPPDPPSHYRHLTPPTSTRPTALTRPKLKCNSSIFYIEPVSAPVFRLGLRPLKIISLPLDPASPLKPYASIFPSHWPRQKATSKPHPRTSGPPPPSHRSSHPPTHPLS